MNIEVYDQEITNDLMDLLLTADPDWNAIHSYLTGSTILVCQIGGKFVGIAVLTNQAELVELKNIAVKQEHHGKGIAKLMINGAKLVARQMGGEIMEVGTGNSSLSQLALYQKCGFRMHRIDPGYFESYAKPILENGIRCIDMVRLRIEL